MILSNFLAMAAKFSSSLIEKSNSLFLMSNKMVPFGADSDFVPENSDVCDGDS